MRRVYCVRCKSGGGGVNGSSVHGSRGSGYGLGWRGKGLKALTGAYRDGDNDDNGSDENGTTRTVCV